MAKRKRTPRKAKPSTSKRKPKNSSVEVKVEEAETEPGEPVKFVAWVKDLASVARIFGVSRGYVNQWIDKGMPGKHSATKWDLVAIVQWHIRDKGVSVHGRRKREETGEEKALEDLKKQELKQKIRKQELAYAREIGALIPRAHVEQFHNVANGKLRQAGELLRKHHGDKAQKIQLDALDAIEKDLESMFRE